MYTYILILRNYCRLFFSSAPSCGNPRRSALARNIFDGGLDEESARRLAEFRFDPAAEARVQELAEHANEGLLTDEERGEYEAFIELGNLISILQLKIKRQLHSNG